MESEVNQATLTGETRMIKFKPVSDPRTKDGGFGLEKCDKCGAKTTGYLKIDLIEECILLCKSCLHTGIELINKTILDGCIRRV
jgi:hypothetical protein